MKPDGVPGRKCIPIQKSSLSILVMIAPMGFIRMEITESMKNNLLFPLSSDDRRLNRKERVHGIITSETTRVYRFDSFGLETTLIQDVIDDTDVIIIGDAGRNYIVSFYAELEDGSKPDFTTINDGSLILEDSEGNKWDIFGFAVEGPRAGQQLKRTESFIGYWFAWGTFYQGVEIFE